jgi:selenocysteine lyase/cysteine desulfurase
LRRQAQGVEVRVMRHRDWRVTPEDLEAHLDGRTRLVVLSMVSYKSGYRHDAAAMARLAHSRGAAFLLDATQALGVIPVDGPAFDFVVASTYKWLLGGHGGGILYWNRARLPGLEPAAVGWRSVPDMFSLNPYAGYRLHESAARFEVGYPSFPTLYMLREGMTLLQEVGIARIEQHVLALGDALIPALRAQGWDVFTSAVPAERAGNVAFAVPDGAGLARRLAERGIHTWGGDGRVRASLHLFNDAGDVERLLTALADLRAT